MMVSITARSERIVVFAVLGLAAALWIAAAIVLPDQSHALVDAIAYRDSAAQLLKSCHCLTCRSIGALGYRSIIARIALAVMLVTLVATEGASQMAISEPRLFDNFVLFASRRLALMSTGAGPEKKAQ